MTRSSTVHAQQGVVSADFGRSGVQLDEVLLNQFDTSLRSQQRSPHTRGNYLTAARFFASYLREVRGPLELGAIRRRHVEQWLNSLTEKGNSAATLGVRYRGLQAFWRWVVDEGEVVESPMAKMKPPTAPEKHVAVISDDELHRLLQRTEADKGFAGRRDAAIIRVLLDAGLRRAELADLRVEDVDHAAGSVRVRSGKGGRERYSGLSPKTLQAIDRYMRLRARHPLASSEWLWLGMTGRGRMYSGIGQMIKERGLSVGIKDLHPHKFRHTFAHSMKAAQAPDEAIMSLGGWRSSAMLRRYGASVASERALAIHQHLALGNRV